MNAGSNRSQLPIHHNDLDRMSQQVVQQMKAYPSIGTKPWTYETAVKDLPVEVGSLTKLVMQLNNERYAHGLSKDDLKLKIADELADLLSLILFIAHELEIDMNEAWALMLTSDDEKMKMRTTKK